MPDRRRTVVVDGAEPRLRIASATDAGRRRKGNEDAFLADFPVFIVADGMGGHDAGAVASAAVIRAFASLVGREDVRPDEVSAAIRRAQQTVAALSDRTRRGAGGIGGLRGRAVLEGDAGEQRAGFGARLPADHRGLSAVRTRS